MHPKIASKALKPNQALKPLEVLIGNWKITGSHPYFPGVTLYGRTTFEWLEGGAFLIVRSEIDHPKFPDGIEIFGSDDMADEFFMLHFDERGTSRKYNVTVTDNELTWWRDDPKFSQRFTLTVEKGSNKMVSKGKMSRGGSVWEDDLVLRYVRIT